MFPEISSRFILLNQKRSENAGKKSYTKFQTMEIYQGDMLKKGENILS
jgi:hypothetical protein